MTTRIVVIEDDDTVRCILQESLASAGYAVTVLDSGIPAEAILSRTPHDLALIDIGLPDIDGLVLTKRLRERFDIGIIIISGRAHLADRVNGLDHGADDYIAKPFDLKEMHARIRSVLRRQKRHPNHTRAEKFQFNGWTYDGGSRTLRDGFGHTVALTTGEYRLLEVFLHAPRSILSREKLLELLHGKLPGDSRSVDVAIMRLRRKLGEDPMTTGAIKTVRGGGYIFVASVSPQPAPLPQPQKMHGI